MKIINLKTFFAAIIITSLHSCSSGNNNEISQEGIIKKEFLANVKTVKATLSNQKQELILSGKVESDPNRVVSYTPLISGMIERTYFTFGDHVTKGQTMLHIRSSELSALQSELIVAHRNLQSAESMYEDRLISEMELIEAHSEYERVQANLSLYGDNLGNGIFSIKSPITGYVVANNASSGSTVSEGDEPLFTVADLSSVWIIANVHAGDLQSVKQGMPVEITTLAYPNEVFSGKIDALSQVFDPEERVLKARIVMPNAALKFKPEMSVVVKVQAPLNPPSRGDLPDGRNQAQAKVPLEGDLGGSELGGLVLSIPSDALIFDDDRYFVVVETTPGEFEIKEVIEQGHYQGISYIRSGLSENDNVVIKNQLLIYSELKGK